MSLAVPASLSEQRNTRLTPFSDLLDLSDNPDTPGTAYSFQELKQSQTMQTDQHYLVEPTLERPFRLHTDDEMFDSDMDRKDDDLDLLDVSSNIGLEDASIIMGEDFLEIADNDDLMIDEVEEGEEDMMLFQQQQQHRDQSPAHAISSSTSLDSNELAQTQETIRPPSSSQAVPGDLPLFSFSHPNDSTNVHNVSFAVSEKAPVPDHSLYEDAPAEGADVVEETAAAKVEVEVPRHDESLPQLNNNDARSLHSQSPTHREDHHTAPSNLSEDHPATDSTEVDNDFHHSGGWSENTSTTLAHEPTLLEDQQTFRDDDEENGNNHIDSAESEVEDHASAEFDEFAPYNLHPIVVQWEKNRLSLFPTPNPIAEESDLEFFIQDPQVCDKGISELFLEFRKVLDGSVSQDAELFIEFEGLGLEIGEDNVSCNSISLQYILNLHVQLHRQDGIETPEPLRINLFTRPSFSKQITSLVAAATQGMGFSEAIGSIGDHTDSHMKEGDQPGSDVQTPKEEFGQDEAQHEADSEDKEVVKDSELVENADASLTPRATGNHDEKPVVENDEKDQSSVKAKVEMDDDDDDEFDLEYGAEEDTEVKDESETGVEVKTDDAQSVSEPSSASETPKPVAGPTSAGSDDIVAASVEVKHTSEMVFEEIPDDAPQHDLQQPEEIEDTDSNVEPGHSPSLYEDEELIEYEEDESAQPALASAEFPIKDTDKHQEDESNSPVHDSPVDEVQHQTADSLHVHVAGTPKSESPGHQSSRESDHTEDNVEKVNRSNSLAGSNEENANETEDFSAGIRAPSSIPVFHGDDGPEDVFDYGEDQQQEYDEQEYQNQIENFEMEEQEYNEEHAGYENSNEENIQAPEYFEEDLFDYNVPAGAEAELQVDVDGYDNYTADDGSYNDFGGEQEYPAEDENGYPVDYPHEGYDEDAAAYGQHGDFGDIDAEAVEDNEFGVSIKEDQEHDLSQSDAVEIMKKPTVDAVQVEEEQLIDYEEDEEVLAKEPAHDSQPSQLPKSPTTEQKRMREDDEPEQSGYDNTSENQAAKRVRSE